MQVRGRYLVFAWTAVFVIAVGTIVIRTRSGFSTRDRVNKLERRIRMLESSKADLQANVARLTSRRVLGANAEAMGLRHPSDTAISNIHIPPHR